MRVDGVAAECGIEAVLARELARLCVAHASRNDGTRFAVGSIREGRCRDRGHFDLQVDAVEQRPADAALVAADRVGRAAAGAHCAAVVAARAWTRCLFAIQQSDPESATKRELGAYHDRGAPSKRTM